MPRKNVTRSKVVSLESRRRTAPQMCEVALGRLVGVSPEGAPLVQIAGEEALRPARSTVALQPRHLGSEVTLLVEERAGRCDPVIITGIVTPAVEAGRGLAGADVREVRLDGESLLLTAEREITFRCGKALIALRADGKVLVKGANLLQSSSGQNRIKGASVEIN